MTSEFDEAAPSLEPEDGNEIHSEEEEFELTPGQFLVNQYEYFLSRQRALLSYADHLAERQEEFDGIRARTMRHLRDRHPEFEDDVLSRGVDLLMLTQADADEELEERFEALFNDLIVHAGDAETARSFLVDIAKAAWQPLALPSVLEASLTSLVSDFEVLVSDLLKVHLNENPRVLGGSERKFTWREVVDADSIEDFTSAVIERTVEELMRDSVTGWIDYLQKKFNVRLPGRSASSEFIELFQRRHVLVHAGGRVNRTYIDKVSELDDLPELGSHISVDIEYLAHAADLLAEVAFALIANSVAVLAPIEGREEIESDLVNIPYRCLQERRYRLAAAICGEFREARFISNSQGLIMSVNFWLAHKLGGTFDTCADEVKRWETSTLSAEYRLAQFALLSRNEEAFQLAKKLVLSGDLARHHWLTWPLLAEVRAYARDNATVEEKTQLSLTTVVSGVVDSKIQGKESGPMSTPDL